MGGDEGVMDGVDDQLVHGGGGEPAEVLQHRAIKQREVTQRDVCSVLWGRPRLVWDHTWGAPGLPREHHRGVVMGELAHVNDALGEGDGLDVLPAESIKQVDFGVKVARAVVCGGLDVHVALNGVLDVRVVAAKGRVGEVGVGVVVVQRGGQRQRGICPVCTTHRPRTRPPSTTIGVLKVRPTGVMVVVGDR